MPGSAAAVMTAVLASVMWVSVAAPDGPLVSSVAVTVGSTGHLSFGVYQ